MSMFDPRDPDFESRVFASFARQGFMATLGARLARVAPGAVDIEVALAERLSQQHGYFHAGVTSSIADSAAGYAALSLFPKGFGVLTSEFKINLLNPAQGPLLVAEGRVVKPGRLLCVCKADVYSGEARAHVATGLFTMVAREGLDD
jgi:uncharacterized protein (TIGR00369 family)